MDQSSAVDQSPIIIDEPPNGSSWINADGGMATAPWLMLERFVFPGDDDDGSFPDANAAPIRAKSVTSLGHPFTVAVLPAKPPAFSRLYLQWPGGKGSGAELLTTDVGLLLLRLTSVVELSTGDTDKYPYHQGYFICKTIPLGPYISLKRLPECTIPIVFNYEDRDVTMDRRFDVDAVGLCRLDDDDDHFLVVQLAKFFVRPAEDDMMGVELCVLRSPLWTSTSGGVEDGDNVVAEGEWEVLELPIRHRKEEFNDIRCWSVDSVLTYGRTILWVDYHQGGMLCFTPGSLFVEYYRLPIDNRPRDSLPSQYRLHKYRSQLDQEVEVAGKVC